LRIETVEQLNWTVNKIRYSNFPSTCPPNDGRDIFGTVMAQARDVSRPIVRTYLRKSTSPSGKPQIHVRLYSPEYDLDKRGSGKNLPQAVRRAKQGLKRPK
jgi:hypothetical protein